MRVCVLDVLRDDDDDDEEDDRVALVSQSSLDRISLSFLAVFFCLSFLLAHHTNNENEFLRRLSHLCTRACVYASPTRLLSATAVIVDAVCCCLRHDDPFCCCILFFIFVLIHRSLQNVRKAIYLSLVG